MHGKGTLFFVNGEKYIGEFRDGNFNGEGEFNTKDGVVIKGVWENGILKQMHEEGN